MNITNEDAAREERYAHLRIRKARCERTFTVCLAACGLLAAIEVLLIGSFAGVTLFGESAVKGCIFLASNLGMIVCLLLGICKRNRWLTGAAMMLWLISCLLQGKIYYYGMLACMIITLMTVLEWDKLRHKEGFPLFEIPIREQETHGNYSDLTVRNLPPAPLPETAPQDGQRHFTPGEMDTI